MKVTIVNQTLDDDFIVFGEDETESFEKACAEIAKRGWKTDDCYSIVDDEEKNDTIDQSNYFVWNYVPRIARLSSPCF
jgi:hypothetical protein